MNTINSDFTAARKANKLTGRDEPWLKYEVISQEEAIKAAQLANLDVVYPEDNQLQLDIDDARGSDRLYEMSGMLDALFQIKDWKTTESKSGGQHKHVTLTLANPISPVERVLLQAILGSDPKRELLTYVRLLKGEENPTLFFEKKRYSDESTTTRK